MNLRTVVLLVAGCGGDDGVHHLADAPPPPGTWTMTSSLPVARTHAVALAPGNGFLYLVNGYTDNAACNTGRADGRVFRAQRNSDGSLGAWTEGTAGTGGFVRSIPSGATANGFLYIAGGAKNAPSWDGAIWFAKPDAGGDLPAWTQATSALPAGEVIGSGPAVGIAGGQLYVGGGFRVGGSVTHMFKATLDASTGQPGVFTQIADVPEVTSNIQLVGSADHVYFVTGGGHVYVASLDGTTWTPTENIPGTAVFPNVEIAGDRLYAIPGVAPGGGAADVYTTTIQSGGALAPWSKLNTAPALLALGEQGVIADGTYYAIGYDECFSSADAAAVAAAKVTYYLPL
jgi:hypothetical protein